MQDKQTKRRAITADDYEAIYTIFAKSAVNIFNAKGEVPPLMVCIGLVQNAPAFTALPLSSELSFSFFRNDATSSMVKPFFRAVFGGDPKTHQIAEIPPDFHVDLIVQVNEAWLARETSENGKLPQNHVMPSQHPDRKEVLLISVHSPEFTTVGDCPILATPERHAEYRPLPGYREIQGRMVMQRDLHEPMH